MVSTSPSEAALTNCVSIVVAEAVSCGAQEITHNHLRIDRVSIHLITATKVQYTAGTAIRSLHWESDKRSSAESAKAHLQST